jgi:hypothetical protein
MPRTTVLALLSLTACGGGDFPDIDSFASELPLVVMDTHGVRVDRDRLWDEDDTRAWAPVDARFIPLAEDGMARLAGPPEYDGRGGLHIRGSSSAEEYEKKSYAFETWDAQDQDQDVSLLGLPEEEDWVLHGPQSDKTLMRNALAYGWHRRMGRYAARTTFVELFVKDRKLGALDWNDYRGVYTFMEKLKRDDNRVDIAKLDPEDSAEPEISGGYLLRVDWLGDEESQFIATERCGCQLQLDSPEASEITSAQRSWLEAWLDDFEAALLGEDFADPQLGYAAWIDVGSFVDYLLVQELARNVDAYVLSTWVYKDREGPLTMGPVWDFNGSLGNADYFQAWETEGWHFDNPEFPEDNPWAWCWWERLLEDPGFRDAVAQRWADLRSSDLSDDALGADIDGWEALLATPAQRNFERWDVLSEYVWPNDEGSEERESYAQEVAYMRAWTLERAAWMDSELAGWEG